MQDDVDEILEGRDDALLAKLKHLVDGMIPAQ